MLFLYGFSLNLPNPIFLQKIHDGCGSQKRAYRNRREEHWRLRRVTKPVATFWKVRIVLLGLLISLMQWCNLYTIFFQSIDNGKIACEKGNVWPKIFFFSIFSTFIIIELCFILKNSQIQLDKIAEFEECRFFFFGILTFSRSTLLMDDIIHADDSEV